MGYEMSVVFIVDDRVTNLKLLRCFAETLEKDVTVHTFDAPERALESLADKIPDLIVTDFVMPTMLGDEFIRRCRQDAGASDIPIIVVTAYEDREYRYRALDAGASDFLVSPVDGREFCIRARHLLTIWHQQKAIKSRAVLLESELETALRMHAEEMRLKEEKLRRVINTVPALIRASDANGRIVFLNTYHEQYFDIDCHTAAGGNSDELLGADYATRHQHLNRQVLESNSMMFGVEENLADRENKQRVLLTTKAPLSDNEGQADSIVTVSLDITERKRGEQAVRESEERFRNLVESSVLGIVIERDGTPLFANHTFAQIFGYDSPDEILALESLDSLYAPDEISRIQGFRTARKKGTVSLDRHEFEGVMKDGVLISVETQMQEVWWKGERALQLTVADITLRKRYEKKLQRQANFDDVTGLPNRVLALDRLRSAVVSAHRYDHKVGVLFIDLDHFKKINDTLGHATGDQLLRMAADRLTSCVREEDTVARLGGDEFTVILPNMTSASHAEPVIHKILETFSQSFVLDRHEAFVTASVGVTVFPDDGDDPNVLMQNADAAMYRAKEHGRDTFQFFTRELNQRAMERMRLESHLLHALDRDELELHYQPIVDVFSQEVVGAEALLRWSNEELGSVRPERFVPLAEDTGLVVPMGKWVLDTACQQIARWREMGLPPLRLSVNVSSRQFRGRGLVEAVSQALEKYGVAAQCLELEITEGLLMDELPQTRATLHALDTLSIRLALDDFGTGYSSLSHLKKFPVDTVKIDRSFIQDISTNPDDATVVDAIIAMAHRLKLQVIGEGVETDNQLEFIRESGCDLAQGYYFSEPLPPEEFAKWVKDRVPLLRKAL